MAGLIAPIFCGALARISRAFGQYSSTTSITHVTSVALSRAFASRGVHPPASVAVTTCSSCNAYFPRPPCPQPNASSVRMNGLRAAVEAGDVNRFIFRPRVVGGIASAASIAPAPALQSQCFAAYTPNAISVTNRIISITSNEVPAIAVTSNARPIFRTQGAVRFFAGLERLLIFGRS